MRTNKEKVEKIQKELLDWKKSIEWQKEKVKQFIPDDKIRLAELDSVIRRINYLQDILKR